MFNIGEFKAIVGKYGIAKPSSFAVNITPPQTIYTSFINDLPLLVDTANIPGVNFDTEDIRYKGYGLSEARVQSAQMDPFTITIIGDAQGQVLGFMNKWMSLIYNYDGESEQNAFGIGAELANYPAEYWGTIELYMYNIASEKYHTYKMVKCYPKTLGEVQLGWEQNDALMRISVTFNYRSMTTNITESLRTNSVAINTVTNTNARNVEQLQSLIPNPNIAQYQQRLLTV